MNVLKASTMVHSRLRWTGLTLSNLRPAATFWRIIRAIPTLRKLFWHLPMATQNRIAGETLGPSQHRSPGALSLWMCRARITKTSAGSRRGHLYGSSLAFAFHRYNNRSLAGSAEGDVHNQLPMTRNGDQ